MKDRKTITCKSTLMLTFSDLQDLAPRSMGFFYRWLVSRPETTLIYQHGSSVSLDILHGISPHFMYCKESNIINYLFNSAPSFIVWYFQYFTSTPTIWSIYVGTVGVVFLCIKVVNCRFHYLFDTTEPVVEPEKENEGVTLGDEEVKVVVKTQNLGLNES